MVPSHEIIATPNLYIPQYANTLSEVQTGQCTMVVHIITYVFQLSALGRMFHVHPALNSMEVKTLLTHILQMCPYTQYTIRNTHNTKCTIHTHAHHTQVHLHLVLSL